MRHSSVALLMLLFTAAAATLHAQGVVTVFREKHTSASAMFFTDKDQWPKHFHAKLFLDGKPLLDMRAEEFASFTLPAGRHLIEFEKHGTGSAQFELHEGERVFIRPAWAGSALYGVRLLMTVVSCKQAIEVGKDAVPVPAKDILQGDALPEERFPDSCPVTAK